MQLTVTIFLLLFVSLCWAQAPGDGDAQCTTDHSNPPQYPDTVRNLMDSYSYENLLPGNGTGDVPITTAVWNDFSFDGNDVTPETLRPTYRDHNLHFDAGCNECPEQMMTTELLRYPKTTVGEGGECVNVTAACVENAVPLSSSLEVTCCSGGVWRVNKELRCKCIDNYKPTDAGTCIENITASVTEDCTDLILTWSPVDGARQYSVRMHENGVYIINTTVNNNLYKASLIDSKIKDETLTLEIAALLGSSNEGTQNNHASISIDTKAQQQGQQEDQQQFTTTQFSIGLAMTFLVTGPSVFFLTCVICLMVGSYRKKKYGSKFSTTNATYTMEEKKLSFTTRTLKRFISWKISKDCGANRVQKSRKLKHAIFGSSLGGNGHDDKPGQGADAPHENCINLPDNARAEFETQLMDSYTHEVLLPESPSTTGAAVWSEFSFDGNDDLMNDIPFWEPITGTSECRRRVQVCGWDREGERQDNWLFTQHISSDFDSNIYNYDVTIHVEATYSLQSCRERLGCRQRFNLLHYMTNSQQLPSTSGNGYMNTQNYENFAVSEGPVSSVTYTNTYNFTLPPSSTGFYIAVQDIGSCIALSRLRVYRNNCKSRQVGLVLYPDAPAPVSGSTNIDISCVENGVVSGSSRVTCGSDGTWGPENPVCQCNCGYEQNMGATRCNEPPSAPGSLSLSPQQSSITVRWSAPADLGGRTDLYYQVEISDPDNLGSFTGTVFLSGSTTSRTISGLRPHTQYCVRVTAHNGVSDQDPDGEHLRTVEECTRTLEARPGVVSGVQGAYPYVVWNPPEEPNGVITGYRLVFSRSGTSTTRTVTTTNDQTFYIIQSSDVPWTSGEFNVTVAAGNSVGFGTQSSPFTLTIGGSTCLLECWDAQIRRIPFLPKNTASFPGFLGRPLGKKQELCSLDTITQPLEQCFICDVYLQSGAFLHVFLSLCWAQAPGDEDARCTTDHSNPPQYPDNETNLMDSYSYENLLPGNGTGNSPIATAVWNDFSLDGNDVTPETLSPTYWQQGAGGICRFQTRVCGWRQNGVVVSQNNWLFTQHISSDFDSNIYNYDVTIHVEATYSLQSCRLRQGCIQSFNLLHYMTNSQQLPSTSGNGYMNTQNYENFAVPEGPVSSVTYTNTYSFTLPPSSTGFYIAVQDIGSCIALSRLRVYRNNCKSRQVGLVLYPDAPAPVSGSANIDISCVDNAVVSGSSRVTCGSDGTWGSQSPVCQCRLGYEKRQTECIACGAGQYRSSEDTTCQRCPANCETDEVAADECECLIDHFRNNENRITAPGAQPFLLPANEPPSASCTQPPSAPGSLSLSPQQSSITASWSAPADLGGRRDLYYQVEISDPDNLGSYTGTVFLSGRTTRRTISGLRPHTQYCVRVAVHNGVSDQDPDGKHLRTVEECTKTSEARPGVVSGVQGAFPYVVWNPPEEPNGVITGYRLVFSRSGTSTTRTVTTTNDQTFYIIQSSDIPWTSGEFRVTVAARNSVGFGTQSSTFTLTINGSLPTNCSGMC
ncbi:Ephrin type-A receptor 5 [Geodia barretti]|uniref:Ephrin type-A receptor 5 n=1 Tax=Geodia barretti TaxID=519541 RepID=A0AA35X3M4_GEOBA|nr:Ephrin type-A receptor 5 [Geodia barretti]